jgi:hypothetical protein
LLDVPVNKQNDDDILARTARAIELTEETLQELARIAVEGIHNGASAGAHAEAAERDMRNALRQLVRTERELRARAALKPEFDESSRGIAEVVPGPRADAVA